MRTVRSFLILFLCSYITTAISFSGLREPRIYIWGLGGEETQARFDGLLPLITAPNSLFYMDAQGGYGTDNAWYSSLGAGYRQLSNTTIYGGYLFVDYDQAYCHNDCNCSYRNNFWVLSPGVEILFPIWDFRLNGYVPVSAKRLRSRSFFQSGANSCGVNGDCSFVEFKGHQQFDHRFFYFQEVGPGLDIEVGRTIPYLNNTQVHAGAYHYNLTDIRDINGIEARIDIPFNPQWAFTVETSYDNYEHASGVVGFRFNWPTRSSTSVNAVDRMREPITRNIGSLYSGAGIPIVCGKKDEGLFLVRDNIFFFTSKNGSGFVNANQSGSFENPLSNDQFTQVVVDQLPANANLYFNSGSYVINPISIDPLPPNAEILLQQGQSIFGRSSNYKCSAIENERPVLLGELILSGDNTLDSIQLKNELSHVDRGPQAVYNLEIINASNIHICNCALTATNTVIGDYNELPAINEAANILTTNSEFVITNSTLLTDSSVLGNNNGIVFSFNLDLGTGSNTFVIENSSLDALGTIAGNNTNHLATVNMTAPARVHAEDNNHFLIANSILNAQGLVVGDNDRFTLARNININANNNFTILNSKLNAEFEVGNDNNLALHAENIEMAGDFNRINIINSTLNSETRTTGDNNLRITSFALSLLLSDNNQINIQNSTLSAASFVAGNNTATGSNRASGIQDAGMNNKINITSSEFNVLSQVAGNNLGLNEATGLFANNNSVFDINSSVVQVSALVLGNNLGANTATGIAGPGIINSEDTTFIISANP